MWETVEGASWISGEFGDRWYALRVLARSSSGKLERLGVNYCVISELEGDPIHKDLLLEVFDTLVKQLEIDARLYDYRII